MVFVLFLQVMAGASAPLFAASSPLFQSKAVEASLVTAADGVSQGVGTLSAGFRVVLADGWKTYWRTPGEVGIAPSIDWSGSENVRNVTFLWPAPHRFHAFGIENFGYKHEVVFPLSIELDRPGEPVHLRAKVNMLTCSIVCVPQDFDLALDLPLGGGLDRASANLIASWAKRVPARGETDGTAFKSAAFTAIPDPAIILELRSQKPFYAPDVFPEVSKGTTFGPPDIRLGDGGHLLWARIPLTGFDEDIASAALTVTDGDRAVSLAPRAFEAVAPKPPYTTRMASPGFLKLVRMALIALVGGLILNVMPCVLPVLSIKLSSAIKVSAGGTARVRAGFLVSAAGVMAFMLVLAGIMIALRALGLAVGWGVQFQNPVFLVAMIALLGLFAANMFGLFEINLPLAWTSKMASASGRPSWLGDFSTGAFAAVLATPCSAPFLGTAVAFALAGRPVDIVIIFSALGLGLALPYLLVAWRPSMITALPKPGRWMLALKAVLGLLLAGTVIWLLWVLQGVGGRDMVFAVGVSLVIALAALALGLPPGRLVQRIRGGVVVAFVVTALAVPFVINPAGISRSDAANTQKIAWIGFDRAVIAKRVSQGEVVFLDITADWCITCKANKALVINRSPVADLLNSGSIVPMQADWTRPNERISRFLKENGRYGIPFNAVYGPKAPDGILLSELLSTEAVLTALRDAGAQVRDSVATAD